MDNATARSTDRTELGMANSWPYKMHRALLAAGFTPLDMEFLTTPEGDKFLRSLKRRLEDRKVPAT